MAALTTGTKETYIGLCINTCEIARNLIQSALNGGSTQKAQFRDRNSSEERNGRGHGEQILSSLITAVSRKWYRGDIRDIPPYEAMIEIKLIWSGSGRANTEHGIRKDIKKLEACLNDGTTKNAIFVLLDGLDSQNRPYFQDYLKSFKRFPSLVVYHWPDSSVPIENPRNANFGKY
jgi:hypothetical protein